MTLSGRSKVTSVRPRRVAVLSVHTSPLEQPGTGDAGGMNVYVVETSKRLAARGVEVEVFTRATSSDLPPVVELAPGVTVRHLIAGPFEGLSKEDLPAQLCALTSGVLRAEAMHEPGFYDVVHSHYWLSGQVGWLATERWGTPLVHTAHTLAKVKNLALADGDVPEPLRRVVGEEQVVAAADRLVANTGEEAQQLVDLYDADPARVVTVAPGVDLEHFRPGEASASRTRLGIPPDAVLLLFVGRIQPLKAPDVLLRAAARMLEHDPGLRDRLVVAVVGGPSGTGLTEPTALQDLATSLGIADLVRFEVPRGNGQLLDWYRAADLVAVPSHNESFGLVALEAQACGTPVVATDVGGLRTTVRDDVSGLLVPGHDAGQWAAALERALVQRSRLSIGAVEHAAGFSWEATADELLATYRASLTDRQAERYAQAVNLWNELHQTIQAALEASELDYHSPGEGQFFVKLPGQHKLATNCWLVAGRHALLVEAFVCRKADENHEEFQRFLLRKNARMYGVAFSMDSVGDVYLVGRLPLQAITAEEVDRLLGSVLTYADESFDPLLEIGFASSIRREWAWRQKNGESTANLQAFARFADPDR